MATLNFPTSPSLNDVYSFNGKTWVWNGLGWQLQSQGAINGIVIGNSTPAAGTFTALSATGNVTSGNVISTGVVSAGNLTVSGNALVGGDLIVNGNVSYLNVDSFNVEDPIIGLGRGANNAPLISDDNKDRGTALWYYDVSESQAFVGYKNSTGKMFAATDVSITSEVVTVNNYGAFVVGGLEGATVSVTGNVTGGNINTAGLISATGNVTGNYILGNGALLTGVITSVSNINNGTSNVNIATPNANVTVSVNGTSNIAVFAATGQYVTGLISASGNIDGANINGNGSGLSSITGANVAGQVGNALTAGTVYTNAQPNITSVGTLTSLSSSGNITGANINGNGSGLSSITGANVTGQVGNALTAGTVYTNAQPNITSVGTLSSLSSSGNIDGANINGNGSGLSAITGANVAGQVPNALVSGTVYTAAQPNITSVGTLSSLSSSGNITGANINGNGSGLSSITGANVAGQVGNALIAGTVYTAAQPNITSVGTLSSLSATGNITSGNLVTTGKVQASDIVNGGTGIYLADGPSGYINFFTSTGDRVSITDTGNISAVGNVIGGNLNAAGLSLSSNVVSALNLSSSLTAAATVSALGNITGGNLATAGAISAASISASANITGGNLITSAAVNAATVSASGNVTGGNVNTNTLVGTSTTIKSTGALNLEPTGNVVVNSTYINGVTNPVQNQDVATKFYVDNAVSTAISYHQPVAATTNTDLATATGGIITYTQPNGAGNGVGALLTTTGSFDLIDTANVQTVGTRILVKNEANAVYNGVYTWANATNIVRSTDTNTYGAGDVLALGINDYFFTTGGNVNLGAAFVVSAPTGTITFGTSNIVFSTFSTSQTYTANTAAGISLIGTVINAKVDGTTTAFDGLGNISVKAGAVLTTPNIGAATGTSVSVTGNITGGNLNATGLSLSGNVISAVNTTANITTTANIAGGNLIQNGVRVYKWTTAESAPANPVPGDEWFIPSSGKLYEYIDDGTSNQWVDQSQSSSFASLAVSGNATIGGSLSAGNINGGANVFSTLFTGTTVSVTGNVTGGNLTTAGTISATGNINGGNIIVTGAIVDNIGNLDLQSTAVNGNINLTPSGTGIVGVATSLSATGNVTGGNLVTAGTISATGNISGGNIIVTGILVDNIGNLDLQSTAVNGNINLTPAGTGIVGVATSLSATGNIQGGNLRTAGLISATGGITGTSLTVSTGTVTLGNITNANGNGVGNIGATGGFFNTVFAKATSAQYADLAETYSADAEYPYGTVVVFGGSHEITVSDISHDTRVAGVISKDPAHLMNSAAMGLPVALTGRVLCQVRGPVRKGDILVNIDTGTAGRLDPAQAAWGCVIGKSLEDYSGEGVAMIEIAVGRF